MSGNYPIVRAKSTMTLPRARDIERDGTVGTLTRFVILLFINCDVYCYALKSYISAKH